MSYPESVSFDVRITCAPTQIESPVRLLEQLANEHGWRLDFPVPDTLPYGNEEHDVWT